MEISIYISEIMSCADPYLEAEINARLDDLTKPPGSLGRLEDLVTHYCLCRGSAAAEISRKKIFTFAGDHGITSEGVTVYPSEVTVQMVLNMAAGGAAVSVLSKNADIEYSVVDIGTKGDFSGISGVLDRKAGSGTKSFLHDNAMTAEECERAVSLGAELGSTEEADIFGIGEMGIGNTSSAAALYSLLLDVDPFETAGAGTGMTGDKLDHKRKVISLAVDFHKKSWDGRPFDALCRVGGFEIAGMCGFIIGAASKRIPVVIDGFISSVSALCAMKYCPDVRDYCIFSHRSSEKFHKDFLKSMNIEPVLDLGMRLGEGTGSALAIQIICQAMNCYHQMATFSSAGVSNKEEDQDA